ncbi:MAG: DUF2946 family protein [Burkholderiaceae bacterium]
MDQQVLDGMKRWPNVPDVIGWLRLDRRGRWLLIDRNTPGFDEALHGRGSPITNEQIIAFIGRNYASTDDGRWYWQNGPQRAFAELDLAPWIARVVERGDDGRLELVTHTGLACEDIRSWHVDAQGVLYAATEHGPCAVHDLDLGSLDIELDIDPDVDADAPPHAGRHGDATDGEATGGDAPRGRLVWNGRSHPLEPAPPLLAGVVLSPLAASRQAG